ncbi:hypothetical protein [Paenibacillus sp. FSL H3-0286]|uniref:hypothetical protein n=1 Tax=Paenibacillus sp. FSL H3-0286 TaxID=2921427 RepID=UPI0032452C1A
MEKELSKDILEIIEGYKKLSDFIENEVPYKFAEDIRQELFLDTYLDQVEERIKKATQSESEAV